MESIPLQHPTRNLITHPPYAPVPTIHTHAHVLPALPKILHLPEDSPPTDALSHYI